MISSEWLEFVGYMGGTPFITTETYWMEVMFVMQKETKMANLGLNVKEV